MAQKYIEGDIVQYDNKIMVVKEPRDGIHFDLSCPKEGFKKDGTRANREFVIWKLIVSRRLINRLRA